MGLEWHSEKRFNRDFRLFAGLVFVAVFFLVLMDSVTNHEVPELPDCGEDDVLGYENYDAEVDERVYKCIHIENVLD